MTFEKWMIAVNLEFEDYFGGFGVNDLPDFLYRKCYDSRMDSADVLEEYIIYYPEFSR